MVEYKVIIVTRKEAPCLYCHESYEFVAGMHFKKHFSGSNAFDRYKEWVAEEYGIDPDHEVFHTSGALTKPEDFEEYEHLFD
jgi:DICT domain-containing protein